MVQYFMPKDSQLMIHLIADTQEGPSAKQKGGIQGQHSNHLCIEPIVLFRMVLDLLHILDCLHSNLLNMLGHQFSTIHLHRARVSILPSPRLHSQLYHPEKQRARTTAIHQGTISAKVRNRTCDSHLVAAKKVDGLATRWKRNPLASFGMIMVHYFAGDCIGLPLLLNSGSS
jgi:hypothetical protein